MIKLFNILQILSALLLIILVLLQSNSSGLGEIFGGSGGNVYSKKRGIEKLLYQLTIIISIIFFGVSLARIVI